MRVFVSVQPVPHAGQSNLSEYIAKSKVEREREHLGERGERPLFTMHEDDLTYVEADAILNPTSGELLAEDLIHAVISPERGSFERAGMTHEERLEAFRDAIRDAVRVMQVELRVKRLFWVGGFHGNTLTPHGHLAFSRWALDYEGNLVYIKHLPESLLPRNLEAQDGTKRFSAGKIAEVFAQSLERRFKPVRFVEIKDPARGIEISRSMVTPAKAELREPTQEERTVGRWLEAEITLSREVTAKGTAHDELVRECETLKAAVVGIDAKARARGARPPSAYVEPARLEELLRGNAGAPPVKVYTDRPQGAVEKYLEVTPIPAAVPVAENLNGPSQDNESRDQKLDTSWHTQTAERPNPGRNTIAKTTGEREPNRIVRADDSTDRQKTRCQSTPSKIKEAVAKGRTGDPPRIGQMSLEELRERTARIAATPTLPERGSIHEGSSLHTARLFPEILTKEQSQAVSGDKPKGAAEHETDHQIVRDNPASTVTPSRTEITTGYLVKQTEVVNEVTLASQVTDGELSCLARSVSFNRLYSERTLSLKEAAATREFEERKSRGETIRSEEINKVRGAVDQLNLKLREAILLDDIYADFCRRRNVKQERLTQGQEDTLKDRDTRMAHVALKNLPAELSQAREKLPAIATTANHKAIEAYHDFREKNALKIELIPDSQEAPSREDTLTPFREGPPLGSVERTSYEEKGLGAENGARAVDQAAVRERIMERIR
jgi:hypothetical protein